MEKFFFGDAELLVLSKGDGFSFLGGDIKGMKVEPSSLFTVKAKNTVTKEIFWLEGKSGWSKATAETQGDKTLFTLSDNEAFLGLTVKITFKTEGRALLIDTEVENKNDTLSVLDITYPVPTLSCNRFDVFYPQASGCVAKDAGRKGLTYSNPYPHHHACMQYFAAYNEVGGLYIGIEDPTASTKRFIVKAENGRARFNLYFNAVGGGKPKNSFKLAGVCRLEVFEGDWYEASMLYSRFVKDKCKWLPELGEKGRTDLPDRFANIPFWVSDFIPNTPYQRENKPKNLSAGSDIYDKDYWIDAVIELEDGATRALVFIHGYVGGVTRFTADDDGVGQRDGARVGVGAGLQVYGSAAASQRGHRRGDARQGIVGCTGRRIVAILRNPDIGAKGGKEKKRQARR